MKWNPDCRFSKTQVKRPEILCVELGVNGHRLHKKAGWGVERQKVLQTPFGRFAHSKPNKKPCKLSSGSPFTQIWTLKLSGLTFAQFPGHQRFTCTPANKHLGDHKGEILPPWPLGLTDGRVSQFFTHLPRDPEIKGDHLHCSTGPKRENQKVRRSIQFWATGFSLASNFGGPFQKQTSSKPHGFLSMTPGKKKKKKEKTKKRGRPWVRVKQEMAYEINHGLRPAAFQAIKLPPLRPHPSPPADFGFGGSSPEPPTPDSGALSLGGRSTPDRRNPPSSKQPNLWFSFFLFIPNHLCQKLVFLLVFVVFVFFFPNQLCQKLVLQTTCVKNGSFFCLGSRPVLRVDLKEDQEDAPLPPALFYGHCV